MVIDAKRAREACGVLFLLALSGSVASGTERQIPAAGPPEAQLHYTEERNACANRTPFRQAWFGDLHVHTALSADAYQQGIRTMPEDAYLFARGKAIEFLGTRVTIDRPLDFAAVTDHAEYLGDLNRCTAPEDPAFPTPACVAIREGSGASFQVLQAEFDKDTQGTASERVTRALKVLFESEDPKRKTTLCGENGKSCEAALASAWLRIQTAAENAYDRSAECKFTAFVGYEYTGTKIGSNYHRNIIFRNARVPLAPVSYLDAGEDHLLWRLLERNCTRGVAGCEYLAIPHNSNLSNGKLLTPDYSSATSRNGRQALAMLRQKAEPIMEIFQHKGQSECINGLSGIEARPDPLCDFEQVRQIGGKTVILGTELTTDECRDGFGDGGMIDTGCISRNDFLRGALLTGLDQEQRLGVNPLKLGVIGSTDTHASTPGAVDEETWAGHVGREARLEQRLQRKTGLPYRLDGNPGGLAGVWAVENSRDAIFDALQRREVFGTSGPRIRPRFFGGWDFPEDLCGRSSLLENAYREGVPMGADLTGLPGPEARPRFVAAAMRDPEGNPLQRLQLIKGWLDSQGKPHVTVTDVAGDSGGNGYNDLCSVYSDEAFNPQEPAYYYLRVIEIPTLRWSWAQCLALPEPERPPECSNDAPKTIQERAWTSPVWYVPSGTGAVAVR